MNQINLGFGRKVKGSRFKVQSSKFKVIGA
jgi:hypothetical protein